MPPFRACLAAFASTLTLAACASTGSVARSDSQAALMSNYLMGRYADLTNNPGLAAQNYFSALKRSPSDPVLIEGAVDSALVAGDVDGAAAAAKLAQARHADTALGRLTLAVLSLKAGRYPMAHDLAPPSEGPPFDRLASRVVRAWALAGEGKTDQAVAALGDSGDAMPFARLFDYQRAMIFEYGGRNQDALTAYDSALRSGLRSPSGIAEYGALLQRAGKADQAIQLYKATLAAGADPIVAAAMARAQQGQAPVSALTQPARGAAMGLFSLASLLLGQTDADFYLPYVTLALALDPSLDSARIVYAEGLQDMRLWTQADAALDQVPATSPLYERALVQQVLLLRQNDQTDEALKRARLAVEKTHGVLARLALADLLRDQEKWSEAEPIYDALLKERADAPEEWRLYFARGACRERMGQWREAEADLKQALALSPDQPEALNYLGYSWIDQGINLKEAMKLIERAVALKPDAGYIVDSLGWAYFKLGDYGPAVEQLERAVELLPEDPILNDHLGDAYWREGRRAEARFQWSRSLALKPSAADEAATRAKLAKGLPPEPLRRTAHADQGR